MPKGRDVHGQEDLMNNYWNKAGLLNAGPNRDGIDENSILYTNQYYHLTKGEWDNTPLIKFIERCHPTHGIFNQRPILNGSKEDWMSHDQLTTIMNISYDLGLDWHKEVWSEIKRQGYFRYDNVNPEAPKSLLHPRDIIYYAYLNKHWIGYVFFPMYILIILEAMLNTRKSRPVWYDRLVTRWKTGLWPEYRTMYKTDDQLILYTNINSCKDRFGYKIIKKIIDFIIKHKYKGWKNIFSIYFPEDHPNKVLSSEKNI